MKKVLRNYFLRKAEEYNIGESIYGIPVSDIPTDTFLYARIELARSIRNMYLDVASIFE